MIIKNFEQWLAEDVERSFGIERIRPQEHIGMQVWLEAQNHNAELSSNVKRLQNLLADNVDIWNEDELKIMFIGPLLIEADFNNYPHYKVFSQRKVTLKTEQGEASGKVEWMVAQGKQIPRHPFFFLHEYKSEKASGNDPLGQLLIAMVYAQKENADNLPIHGVYVLGRFWFFVLLEDKTYSVSPAFDATKVEDLAAILANMEKVKAGIHKQLNI